MKKRALVFNGIIAAVSLTSFSFASWNHAVLSKEKMVNSKLDVIEKAIENPNDTPSNPYFFYDLGSRYFATITKEKLHRAMSILDLVPVESTVGIESFRDVNIGVLTDDGEKFENGISYGLNWAQTILLQSVNYSTDIYIKAFCKRKNPQTGEIEDERFIYYITTVPEKEAAFKGGQLALMNYLKENSSEETANAKKEELKSGKVHFTVTHSGEITNVKLKSTSGYSAIDKTMIELIKKMPENWDPAENPKGEKVDQELVFSFGMIGC